MPGRARRRASDDLQQPGLLRSYLEDLREIRQVKARKGMERFVAGAALKVRAPAPCPLPDVPPGA